MQRRSFIGAVASLVATPLDSRDCGYDKDFSTAIKKLIVQDRQKLFRG